MLERHEAKRINYLPEKNIFLYLAKDLIDDDPQGNRNIGSDMTEFVFATEKGAKLVRNGIKAICADIKDDRLTRKQALDRASDLWEELSAFDDGTLDPEAIEAVVKQLNTAFSQAGFVSLKADEFTRHFEDWSRNGKAVKHQALGFDAAIVSNVTNRITSTLKELGGIPGITLGVSESNQVVEEYGNISESAGNVVIYCHRGEYSQNPLIGAMLIGREGWCFLEAVASLDNFESVLREHVFKDEVVDYQGVIEKLRALDEMIKGFNLSSSLLNEPEMLGVTITHSDAFPTLRAQWDGDVIATRQSDEEMGLDSARVATLSTLFSAGVIPDEFWPEELDFSSVQSTGPSAF
ncbi:hypothetical protein ACFOY8_12825 [Thalassospira xianhensis]|uniref:Uncharacterized protein n=1 Tax=Thalassospira xianhensis MCCC 1A02616 TaxID=1177929 RepID=A0A367UE39_9PROT|nr:hypothetical protein [Thalassospira xianhensis]RCK06271.1 hypothetical protein TH5_08605 [Thalassospira xianhensis MCCC 1A02616]